MVSDNHWLDVAAKYTLHGTTDFTNSQSSLNGIDDEAHEVFAASRSVDEPCLMVLQDAV